MNLSFWLVFLVGFLVRSVRIGLVHTKDFIGRRQNTSASIVRRGGWRTGGVGLAEGVPQRSALALLHGVQQVQGGPTEARFNCTETGTSQLAQIDAAKEIA